jgi:DNA-directed RNA polymerase II subunit RPB1
VQRLRFYGIEDEENEEDSASMQLKDFMDRILNEMALSGIPRITKVTFTTYEEWYYDPVTGAKEFEMEDEKKKAKSWLLETDGVALSEVLGFEEIDYKKTVSNDIQEILRVLGIEAVRLSLINELRFVLGSYGIYVNYRHLSTLCDVMTQRGILTSITRHGINRVDTGPLRKCSFEETVEILYEAAFYAESDSLSGITENIIMGQLAPYGTGSFDLVVDN